MTLTPLELLDEAHRAGCEHVCLFVHVPSAVRDRYPVVGPDDIGELRDAIARTEVSVYNVEVFPLFTETDPASFGDALGLARSLGARQATVHLHCPDEATACGHLRELGRVADDFGIALGLEFNAFSSVRSPSEALRLVETAQVPNLSIVADFLHCVRSGEALAAIQAISPYVTYAQLCDGPRSVAPEARWREALSDRLPPGTGDFPIGDLIASLPHVRVWEIEVPQRPATSGPGETSERIAHLVAAARQTLIGS